MLTKKEKNWRLVATASNKEKTEVVNLIDCWTYYLIYNPLFQFDKKRIANYSKALDCFLEVAESLEDIEIIRRDNLGNIVRTEKY